MEYLPTNKTGHADGLSRLIPNQCQPLEDSLTAALRSDCEIKSIIENTVWDLPVTLSEIKSETMKDDFINDIKQKKSHQRTTAFQMCTHHVTASYCTVTVIIPKKLQKRILKDVHTGHPGKNRMKSFMRSYVYWPAMGKDIIDRINVCRGCALAAKAPATPFKPCPKTDQPWSRIHIDFTSPQEDNYYLIVVDSHSMWPEVLRCKRPTTAVTIGFLHELFARFGVPDCVVSDNDTQFTLAEFKDFCNTFQMKHVTTPQYHPRSNGQVERFVDTLKRALKKAQGTPTDRALQQFLQVYRITLNPNTPSTGSPVEIMFARKIRSAFDKLIPKQSKTNTTEHVTRKRFLPGQKIFSKIFKRICRPGKRERSLAGSAKWYT